MLFDDIDCSVQVSRQNQSADRAAMYPVFQRFLHVCTATATELRCRLERVSNDEPATSTYSLVAGHSQEVAPRGISDMFGETVIFEHPVDVQVLNGNSTIVIRYHATGLMQKIFTLVGNPLVLDCQQVNNFSTVTATFDLSRYPTLQVFQSLLGFYEMTWVLDYHSIGEGGEVFQSDIYSYSLILEGMWGGIVFNLTGEHDKPFTRFSSFDCHGLDFTFRNTMQNNRNVADFGNIQFLVGKKLKSRLWVRDALEPLFISGKTNLDLLDSFLLFEPSVEIVECLGQSVRTVLQDLGMDTFEIRIRILDLLDYLIQLELRKISTVGMVDIFPDCQKEVIHLAGEVELGVQSRHLFPRRIKPIFVVSQFSHIRPQLYWFENIYAFGMEATESIRGWSVSHPSKESGF